MNERSRRHQNRRNLHSQASAQMAGQHYFQQPQNNHSLHHGHPSDSYSTSNYRHPSTTTTTTTSTTEPSNSPYQSSSNVGDCSSSIFYSYLIAITSSFLVVLGIYLSLTRFNLYYLYVSLVGLCIVIISACIYCVSNIRSSKLARRKQRINSNELVLGNNVASLNNRNLDTNVNRQQEIATITHILNNRTLTSNNNVIDNALNSTAINNNNQPQPENIIGEPIVLSHTSNNDNNNNASPVTNAGQAIDQNNFVSGRDRINNNNDNCQQQDQTDSITSTSTATQDTSSNLLPNSSQPERQTEDKLVSSKTGGEVEPISSTCNDENHSVIESVVEITNNTDNLATTNEITVAIVGTNASEPQVDSQETNEPIDLINLEQGGGGPAQQVTRSKRKNQQQRAANMRRTLVMGISGEEEVIEINEEDLDNMSILPPSYESLATPITNQSTSD